MAKKTDEVSRVISIKKFRKAFRSEESKFRTLTAFKLIGVFLTAYLTGAFLLFNLLTINLIFFEAHGLPEYKEIKSAYFEYIMQGVLNTLPWICVLLVFLFFFGSYIGALLVRPFRELGDYSFKAKEKLNQEYNPDQFSALKSLTRMSDYFFNYLNLSRKEGKFLDVVLPGHFTRIHKPIFEQVFFLHFFLLMSIACIFSAVVLNIILVDVYGLIVDFSLGAVEHAKSVELFLAKEAWVFNSMMTFSMILLVILNILLGINLYTKVSGAAFGIFATMRSFLKGNHNARVHLIGFNHLREHTRDLNKFLDQIVRELDNKG